MGLILVVVEGEEGRLKRAWRSLRDGGVDGGAAASLEQGYTSPGTRAYSMIIVRISPGKEV